MVLLSGPRQVGKTTLCKEILDLSKSGSDSNEGTYFNWDFDDDRESILKGTWNSRSKLIVFDELHKFPRWKNWLKGTFDKNKSRQNYLVTGSARLDVYRRGGDSMLGRYHHWRLHPFTLSEPIKGLSQTEMLGRLMELGGFPEPLVEGSPSYAKRWRQERLDRVLKEDIRDLESIEKIQSLGLFVRALRERVGSPLVLANIAQDIQITQKTLKKWLEALERMYLVFAVRPFTRNIARSIQKPTRVYFYDNGDVIGDDGARFENLVATSLLKELHFREDSTGERYELSYVRDKDGREVDFVVSRDSIPIALIEAKWADPSPSKHLIYFGEKLPKAKRIQVVSKLKHPTRVSGVETLSAWDALGPNGFSFLD